MRWVLAGNHAVGDWGMVGEEFLIDNQFFCSASSSEVRSDGGWKKGGSFRRFFFFSFLLRKRQRFSIIKTDISKTRHLEVFGSYINILIFPSQSKNLSKTHHQLMNQTDALKLIFPVLLPANAIEHVEGMLPDLIPDIL